MINQNVIDALRVLDVLSNGRMKAEDISKASSVPISRTRDTLRTLSDSGTLNSKKGPAGGYEIINTEITLRDAMRLQNPDFGDNLNETVLNVMNLVNDLVDSPLGELLNIQIQASETVSETTPETVSSSND